MSTPLALVIDGSVEPGPLPEGLMVEIAPPGDLQSAWKSLAERTQTGWFGGMRAEQVSRTFLAGVCRDLADRTEDGLAVPLAPPPGLPALWTSVPIDIAQVVPEAEQTALLLVRNRSRQEEPRFDAAWSVLLVEGAPQGRIEPSELPSLVPGSPRSRGGVRRAIDELTDRFTQRGVPMVPRLALTAGLWLLQDDLDRSHSCSQQIEGAEGHYGDYWHAIMHRREPDYINSKYWFRRVGRHPVQATLAASLAAGAFDPIPSRWREKLARGGWDGLAFVDLCEAAEGNPELDAFARRVQWAEMLTLFVATAAACPRL